MRTPSTVRLTLADDSKKIPLHLQTKIVGNLVRITIHLTPYIKVGIWFHPVLMNLDPVEVSPQSGCVHGTCNVGNDIDIVTDSSPPQEVSPGLMHMGDGSF
jgi:hypothetical protein